QHGRSGRPRGEPGCSVPSIPFLAARRRCLSLRQEASIMNKSARWLALLAVLVCIALSPGRAAALLPPSSDTLSVSVTGNGASLFGEAAILFENNTIPEGGTFTTRALTINF